MRIAKERNPLDDCEVCQAASPEAWTPAPPLEVESLSVEHTVGTRVVWVGQGPGVEYDVAGGLVSSLATDQGVDSASCLSDDQTALFWTDLRPAPDAGEAYYYLVRSQKSCGSGSYGAATHTPLLASVRQWPKGSIRGLRSGLPRHDKILTRDWDAANVDSRTYRATFVAPSSSPKKE